MKKKIIIFTSRGGGGHLSVSNALQKALEREYQVEQVLIMADVLQSVDPAQVMSLGLLKGEDTYNYLIQHQWNKTLSRAIGISLRYFNWRRDHIKQRLNDYLMAQQPDLVISAFHLFNKSIMECTAQHNIPFLLIPTDFDVQAFIHGIKNPADTMKIALPFSSTEISTTIANSHFKESQQHITGFPLRAEFKEATFDAHVHFNLPTDRPLIMVLMGAQGSKAIISYAKQLSHLPLPAHIIFCIGRHEATGDAIKKISFAPHVSFSCIGFTDKIAALMQCATLIISKSGSVSVAEALYSKTPLILDATYYPLAWEKFNHGFIEKYGFGYSLRAIEDVCKVVTMMLEPQNYQRIKANLASFEKKWGTAEIKSVIDAWLASCAPRPRATQQSALSL